jgi:hypothetical protein
MLRGEVVLTGQKEKDHLSVELLLPRKVMALLATMW